MSCGYANCICQAGVSVKWGGNQQHKDWAGHVPNELVHSSPLLTFQYYHRMNIWMAAWKWMSCGYTTCICGAGVPVKWGPESATLGPNWASTEWIGAFQPSLSFQYYFRWNISMVAWKWRTCSDATCVCSVGVAVQQLYQESTIHTMNLVLAAWFGAFQSLISSQYYLRWNISMVAWK